MKEYFMKFWLYEIPFKFDPCRPYAAHERTQYYLPFKSLPW
jgi:hypothetical protein